MPIPPTPSGNNGLVCGLPVPPGEVIRDIRNTAVDILNRVQNASRDLRARIYGLSHEVPFDRWFYHFDVELNLSDAEIGTKIQARAWALFSLVESVVRGVAAVVQHCFAKVFDNMPVEESLNMLRAQWDSIRLSANAVIFPEQTIQVAKTGDESGQLPIGRLLSHGSTQGTPYP